MEGSPHCRQVCSNQRFRAGARLLEQFSTPHSADGEAVARAYPWLVSWDGGEAEGLLGAAHRCQCCLGSGAAGRAHVSQEDAIVAL